MTLQIPIATNAIVHSDQHGLKPTLNPIYSPEISLQIPFATYSAWGKVTAHLFFYAAIGSEGSLLIETCITYELSANQIGHSNGDIIVIVWLHRQTISIYKIETSLIFAISPSALITAATRRGIALVRV